MTTCAATTLVGEGDPCEVTFVTSVTADSKDDFRVDVTGAQGPVDILLDLPSSATETVTLTIKGGEGPVAGKDRAYTVYTGSCTCIPVSTGETVHADGMLYFTLSASVGLGAIKPRIAVFKHLRTVSY